ncbi:MULTISPECIES: LLM class flavin-dependent oxidoreductase [unclassified Chelatococcus]|uniref:LLM class flavin-dependent oxidoreductase n=1 Tax=unclassified Chelatococcus TaxID=2638111 RepID=UPI001BD093E3|nr:MULTISPECIES: LLM class flavin-dependent oxidoreductase [unclassified Chelatococcus]MBS7700705.1 LLM class flavin-dependent oxidoreductase [Chelatococcus sp. YT9]MBX3559289.1 LLM class flavin-dependent oxidoreductase [Chelatococcus sp.]
MSTTREVKFGFQLSAVDAHGASDAQLYEALLRDARLGYELGYDIAWVVEHHFSDYFPQPSPLSILSHVAALCPGIGLGTMVLVTPWHQPVRLAGEIAVLSHLSKGPLHLGMGRGNAPMEYEAFGVPMAEAKQRFEETWRILSLAMEGKPFTFTGKTLSVEREIRIRPFPDTGKINFYGAIGNPASATKIAELGLAPISNGSLPFDVQRNVMRTWTEVAKARNVDTDVDRPVGVTLVMADTDAEADALARRYLPRWFELQVEHYAYDASRHKDLPDYRPFAETHERRIRMTDPANLDPLLEVSLVGSPATVVHRLQTYVDIGFNSFILQTSSPDIPQPLHAEWLTRFAREVAPAFSTNFANGRREAAA